MASKIAKILVLIVLLGAVAWAIETLIRPGVAEGVGSHISN